MSNRKKERTSLLLIVFLMFLTAIALSTTTYAWFSANKMVTIDSFDIKVATVGGIDISADGKEWGYILSTADLIEVNSTTYSSAVNQFPEYIEPVSTGGNINANGRLEMFYGTASTENEETTLTATQSTEQAGYGIESNGKFIAFDIFLKTASTKELYLSNISGVEALLENEDDESVGIENAFRIAFVIEGNVADGTNLNTIQSLAGATSNNLYIWEPNYDTHTSSGADNAHATYGITVNETNAPRLPYDGIIDTIVTGDNVLLSTANKNNFPTKFKTVNISSATRKNESNFTSAFTINEGITKVRMYIWIEGQDVDCENDASLGGARFFLQLTTTPA